MASQRLPRAWPLPDTNALYGPITAVHGRRHDLPQLPPRKCTCTALRRAEDQCFPAVVTAVERYGPTA
jgi:hypothetical protein